MCIRDRAQAIHSAPDLWGYPLNNETDNGPPAIVVNSITRDGCTQAPPATVSNPCVVTVVTTNTPTNAAVGNAVALNGVLNLTAFPNNCGTGTVEVCGAGLPQNPCVTGVGGCDNTFPLIGTGNTLCPSTGVIPPGCTTNAYYFQYIDNLGGAGQISTGSSSGTAYVYPSKHGNYGNFIGAVTTANAQWITAYGGGTTSGPAVGLSPTSLAFGSVPVGTTSGALSITVTNSGTANLNISAISSNLGDYAESDNCVGNIVAPSGTCTISVIFTPAATGSRPGSLSISDNASGSPQAAPLTGSGGSATVGIVLTPGAVNYGQVVVGNNASQVLTLTNSGSVNAVSISAGFANGGCVNGADFTLPSQTCGATLNFGNSCTYTVRYAPSSANAASCSFFVSAQPQGGGTVVTDTTTLQGTGTPPLTYSVPGPVIQFPVTGFINSSTLDEIVTVNVAPSDIFSTITITGTNAADFTKADNCSGLTFLTGNNCTIAITFLPTAWGLRTATLTINDNTTTTPHVFSLQGFGAAYRDLTSGATVQSGTSVH